MNKYKVIFSFKSYFEIEANDEEDAMRKCDEISNFELVDKHLDDAEITYEDVEVDW